MVCNDYKKILRLFLKDVSVETAAWVGGCGGSCGELRRCFYISAYW